MGYRFIKTDWALVCVFWTCWNELNLGLCTKRACLRVGTRKDWFMSCYWGSEPEEVNDGAAFSVSLPHRTPLCLWTWREGRACEFTPLSRDPQPNSFVPAPSEVWPLLWRVPKLPTFFLTPEDFDIIPLLGFLPHPFRGFFWEHMLVNYFKMMVRLRISF